MTRKIRSDKGKTIVNLVGRKFNKLTVLCKTSTVKHHKWLCQCDCGKIIETHGQSLLKKKIVSCGCLKRKNIGNFEFTIGQKVGFVTITNLYYHNNYNIKFYHYKCICGKSGWFRYRKDRDNIKIKSCGCYGLAYAGISGAYFYTIKEHAKIKNLEFTINIKEIWDIFLRQRGICVLSGEKIKLCRDANLKTASLDRIDSNKGYVPNNVQWVHKEINDFKSNWSEQELFFLSKRIYLHNKEKYEPPTTFAR